MSKTDREARDERAQPRVPGDLSSEERSHLALQTGRPPASKKRSVTRRKLTESGCGGPAGRQLKR